MKLHYPNHPQDKSTVVFSCFLLACLITLIFVVSWWADGDTSAQAGIFERLNEPARADNVHYNYGTFRPEKNLKKNEHKPLATISPAPVAPSPAASQSASPAPETSASPEVQTSAIPSPEASPASTGAPAPASPSPGGEASPTTAPASASPEGAASPSAAPAVAPTR